MFYHIYESKAESGTWRLPVSCVETIQGNGHLRKDGGNHLLGIAHGPFGCSTSHSLIISAGRHRGKLTGIKEAVCCKRPGLFSKEVYCCCFIMSSYTWIVPE